MLCETVSLPVRFRMQQKQRLSMNESYCREMLLEQFRIHYEIVRD